MRFFQGKFPEVLVFKEGRNDLLMRCWVHDVVKRMVGLAADAHV